MRIFMIGATGLLGSEAVKVLLEQGHHITSLVLPDLPPGFSKPEGLELVFGNYMEQTNDRLARLMQGMDAFVFAAGIDERIEVPAPAYDVFIKYNNLPLQNMLAAAKAANVKRAVVCGSYFSHFNRVWPELQLAVKHPYIRSRVEQEQLALSFASDDFAVSVIEIPYVFGTQPGRKPVWAFLVGLIRSMPLATFYAKGGTAAVTARQVGQAIAGAAAGKGIAGPLPLGWFDLTWKDMFRQIHAVMGRPHRKVIAVPKKFFAMGAAKRMQSLAERGLEGGLELVSFTEVLYREAYIAREEGALQLGVTDDDLRQAVNDSIRLSLDFVDGKTSGVEMNIDKQ